MERTVFSCKERCSVRFGAEHQHMFGDSERERRWYHTPAEGAARRSYSSATERDQMLIANDDESCVAKETYTAV